jgi:hypothetical protein
MAITQLGLVMEGVVLLHRLLGRQFAVLAAEVEQLTVLQQVLLQEMLLAVGVVERLAYLTVLLAHLILVVAVVALGTLVLLVVLVDLGL